MVSLQKESAAAHKAVTLRDVEEGAVTLRKVGESLAGLKGEKKSHDPMPWKGWRHVQSSYL